MLAARFVVEGPPLGRGASGVVLPAFDQLAGRQVVLKILHPHLAADAEALARLEHEAGAATRLQHRHVLRVHGLWSDGGRYFLVADRVDGGTVDALDAPMSPDAVIALGRQVADALVAAHRQGVTHGDVRPGNVLLGRGGAILFDFGLGARAAVRPGETAPEVAAGAPPGPTADVYGLGVVLYRAMAGRPPFAELTPWAALGAQRGGRPPLPPGPTGLARLVRAMLHPDPASRPLDVATVHAALGRLHRNPARTISLARPWIPPVRPRAAWLVHGIDPATGGPALVRTGLSRSAAVALAEHLGAAGWDVRVDKDALSGRDVLFLLAAVVVGGLAFPLVGSFVCGLVALHGLTRGCRPELARVLPPVQASVPPRRLAWGTEHAVVGGVLLLIAAVTLLVFPPATLLPCALVAWLAWDAWRRREGSLSERATHARLSLLVDETRSAIDAGALGVDGALALHGELDALVAAWTQGDLEGDAVLLRAEALRDLVGAGRAGSGSGRPGALDALQAVAREVGSEPSGAP